MKIRFHEKLVSVEGETMTQPLKVDQFGQPTEEKDITLGMICRNALLAKDEKADVDTHLSRSDLAMRTFKGEKVNNAIEITPEELVDLKKLVGKAYPFPQTIWAAFNILKESSEAVQAASK